MYSSSKETLWLPLVDKIIGCKLELHPNPWSPFLLTQWIITQYKVHFHASVLVWLFILDDGIITSVLCILPIKQIKYRSIIANMNNGSTIMKQDTLRFFRVEIHANFNNIPNILCWTHSRCYIVEVTFHMHIIFFNCNLSFHM